MKKIRYDRRGPLCLEAFSDRVLAKTIDVITKLCCPWVHVIFIAKEANIEDGLGNTTGANRRLEGGLSEHGRKEMGMMTRLSYDRLPPHNLRTNNSIAVGATDQ